jgi:hypothetical protein
MKAIDQIEEEKKTISHESVDEDLLLPLVRGRAVTTVTSSSYPGAVIGELIGMDPEGRVPLVLYPGQPGTAGVAARSVVDLHGGQIGRQVVLMFDRAAPATPIVMGVLKEDPAAPQREESAPIAIDVDGDRVIVTGERQIVLRCGKASITLTREGKVLIHGTYLSCHSSGVNRIKGGSVEIN